MWNETEIKHWNNSKTFWICFSVVTGSIAYLFACLKILLCTSSSRLTRFARNIACSLQHDCKLPEQPVTSSDLDTWPLNRWVVHLSYVNFNRRSTCLRWGLRSATDVTSPGRLAAADRSRHRDQLRLAKWSSTELFSVRNTSSQTVVLFRRQITLKAIDQRIFNCFSGLAEKVVWRLLVRHCADYLVSYVLLSPN